MRKMNRYLLLADGVVVFHAAYVAFVEARQETDAVATIRGATRLSQGQGPARLRGGVESPTSALRHGVDRVRAEDTPPLDTFIRLAVRFEGMPSRIDAAARFCAS